MAAGLSRILVDVLADPTEPEVARLRVFGQVAAALAARPPDTGDNTDDHTDNTDHTGHYADRPTSGGREVRRRGRGLTGAWPPRQGASPDRRPVHRGRPSGTGRLDGMRPHPSRSGSARDVVRHLVEWFPGFLESGAGCTPRRPDHPSTMTPWPRG